MSQKQTSLFDFDAVPEQPVTPVAKPIANAELPLKELPVKANNELNIDDVKNAVLNEPIVEFDATITTPLANEQVAINNDVPKPNSSTVRGRKKLSNTVVMHDEIDVPDDEILFQKKYYAIGVVANMFKVNISLIRFWEKEFDVLKPKLNGKGDRHFRPEDVKNLKLIYHLLRERKYTIEGARAFLKKNKKPDIIFEVIEELKKTKQFLVELKLGL